MEYETNIEGCVVVPSRNGTGVTIGTPEVIAAEKRSINELMNSLILVRCDCQLWEVTLPMKENERCHSCGGLLQIVHGD